jgi:hypothetical protein
MAAKGVKGAGQQLLPPLLQLLVQQQCLEEVGEGV